MSGPTPDGLYVAVSHVPGGGILTGSTRWMLAVKNGPGGIRGNSRPGAVGEVFGGVDGWFKNLRNAGAILQWESGLPTESGPGRGTIRTPLMTLTTVLQDASQPIELRTAKTDRKLGELLLIPATTDAFPTSNASAILEEAMALMREKLFDPALCDSANVQTFWTRMRRAAGLVQDDAELCLAWMIERKHLPFSHCMLGRQLLRDSSELREPTPSTQVGDGPIQVSFEHDVAVMRIPRFNFVDPAPIDIAFSRVAEMQARGLILDLRDNPGGSFIASRVVAHLVAEPVAAGLFFAGSARAAVLRGERDAFPEMAWVESIDAFHALLDQKGAVRWRVDPCEPRFHGPVAVLVNRKVASAAEGLVAGMRVLPRVRIIGERTAGAMLSARTFPLSDGWKITFPTADFVTADGFRPECVGVEPHIRATGDAALTAAKAWIEAQSP